MFTTAPGGRPSPYARLMMTAEAMFLENGFRATGINALLAEAGVAKQTLYNNFASKDELIEAVLRLKSQKVMAWLEGASAARMRNGEDPLQALFAVYGDWFAEPGFSGCLFARAALEYPDRKHPIHKIAASHTRKLFAFLESLCEGAAKGSLPCPAEHLLLLIEGATSVAVKTGAKRASAERALQAAKLLFAA